MATNRQYIITEEESKKFLIEEATIKHMSTLITLAVQESFKPFHKELTQVKRRTNVSFYLITILAALYLLSIGFLIYSKTSKDLPVLVAEKIGH